MITDEQAEKALDYLRDNADKTAAARANRIYMEEYRKSLKAIIMSEYVGEPVNAQERYAYSDPRYIEHLQSIKEAVKQDEQAKWMMTAAEAKLEAWRTMSANNRRG